MDSHAFDNLNLCSMQKRCSPYKQESQDSTTSKFLDDINNILQDLQLLNREVL